MKRKPVDNYNGPVIEGIDVSKWQGDVDWKTVLAANPWIKFVISRTGDGRSTDEKFVQNWAATKGRVTRGSYHYLRADRDGATQAATVAQLMLQNGFDTNDMPPALDLEDGALKNLPGGIYEGSNAQLPVDMVIDESLEFLEVLERELGVTPLIYTGQTFHWLVSQTRPNEAKLFEKYPLWVPSYTAGKPLMPVDKDGNAFPWKQWTIWQYTSGRQLQLFNQKVDSNYFRGDLNTFYAWVNSLHHAKDRTPVAESTLPTTDLTHIIVQLEGEIAALESEHATRINNLKEIVKELKEI